MTKDFGIVEGFCWLERDAVNSRFGEYKHSERRNLISFMSRKGLDVYLYSSNRLRETKESIYAAAFDPNLIGDRNEWKKTFSHAKEKGIKFIWGLNPGSYKPFLDLHPGWQGYERKIMNVIDNVLSLGAAGIFFQFDDTPGADSELDLYKQSNLIMRAEIVNPGLVYGLCPTRYYGQKEELERNHRILDANIPSRIPFIITGPKVWCHEIDARHIPDYASERKTILWDNWMASDTSEPSRLSLSPPERRTSELYQKIQSYILNPCFPSERVIPVISAVAALKNNKMGPLMRKESATLPNGNLITWHEKTAEYIKTLDIMSQDWAEFLGVDEELTKRIIYKANSLQAPAIKVEDYDKVIQKWPSLEQIISYHSRK